MMERCIELDLLCADTCRLAAAAMARADEHTIDYVKQICSLCATICAACGEECAQHEDEHCQRCASASKQCAEECRKMAAA